MNGTSEVSTRASGVIGKIRTRGFWRVLIRPTEFHARRIPAIGQLEPLIEESHVKMRGWDFPHLSGKHDSNLDVDSVWQELDWSDHVEAWRLFQSGQFISYEGFQDDWVDQSLFVTAGKNWKPGITLPITDTLFKFTEVFEFASRLAATHASAEHLHIEIKLSGLNGRKLRMDNPNRSSLSFDRIAKIDEFPQDWTVLRSDLVGKPREYALDAVEECFARFGFSPGREFLRAMQGEIDRFSAR